jgi:phosphonopyruvate decarboxylase
MVEPGDLFQSLTAQGITFFTGVPDSLLKDFCAYVTDHTAPDAHVISANEGAAVALAAGHYLATGRPAAVYMQNSGQGNAVNPLTSLADPEVFGIPMLLMIGWRGEPGRPDEPQHVKQGRITLDLLDALEIPYDVLPEEPAAAAECVRAAVAAMMDAQAPRAIVVRDRTFGSYKLRERDGASFELTREAALHRVLASLAADDVVVATTGKLSRELFEYREGRQELARPDFRTVGSMGHASQIALGVALARPERRVVCLDGDGAAIMHMGAFAIIGTQHPKRFKHIVFNNGAHESVGGQPTAGFDIDLGAVARACGYTIAVTASTADEIDRQLAAVMEATGPALLEIRVGKGARANLGRPTVTPAANKCAFMDAVAV